ncbi:hypothetical protein RQ831_18435 [Roseomonas gilardii]|uniref:Uncharacterized protein n=1 Tax=Roseomonas gilardii TaxID=257708 RepID=A0ABU3MK37_9PROT|nr:hypothetical protein [Roseomonas gilardii]MDT8333035.1 hypothetical protein [Roseomonas gilardii]
MTADAQTLREIAEIEDPHVIRRHGAFFRPDAHGYCTDIVGAGVFSGEVARQYLDVEGLTIHPIGRFQREIELVLEGAERLRSALAASQEQRRG